MTEETTTEIWKDIPGYESLYQVSTLGRVKSLRRTVKRKNGYSLPIRERILKPRKDRYGYLNVVLQKEGKIKCMSIHRLVCEAFLPNQNNLPQVNHKDENPLNNNVENLEWCSHLYNCHYGTRNVRIAKANSKPVKCFETGEIYPSIMELGRKFGFSTGDICACCNNKRNSAYGYHWQYVEQ